MIAAFKDRKPETQAVNPTPPRSLAVCAIPKKPNQCFVEAENAQFAYKVLLDGTHSRCTCQNYTAGVKNNNSFQCSHIIAARRNPPPSITGAKGKPEEVINAILSKPFPENKIQTRQDGTRYIEIIDVVERFNEAFGSTGWSFSHKEPMEIDDTQEIVCSGRIEAYSGDRLVFKEHSGSCKYGELRNGKTVSYGEARIGSIHVALKNCASLFGVGQKQLHAIELPRLAAPTNNYQPARSVNSQNEIPF